LFKDKQLFFTLSSELGMEVEVKLTYGEIKTKNALAEKFFTKRIGN
jgi:hypothetical protein